MACRRVPLSKLVEYINKVFAPVAKKKVTLEFDLDEIRILIHALLVCQKPQDMKTIIELHNRLVMAVHKYEKFRG